MIEQHALGNETYSNVQAILERMNQRLRKSFDDNSFRDRYHAYAFNSDILRENIDNLERMGGTPTLVLVYRDKGLKDLLTRVSWFPLRDLAYRIQERAEENPDSVPQDVKNDVDCYLNMMDLDDQG